MQDRGRLPGLSTNWSSSSILEEMYRGRERGGEEVDRSLSNLKSYKREKTCFKQLKVARRNKVSSIKKLHVQDKTYLDGAVPDGFYDSITGIKSGYVEKLG